MTADAYGNDVAAVGVPVTGYLAYAPGGTTLPMPSEGASPTYVLPAAFKKLGLLTEDGGFQWTEEPDGDPLTFYQDGYSTPTGLANAQLVAKAAQYNELVRSVTYGQTPDANGYIEIDAGGHADRYVLFSEEIFKNGVIRRRVAADAGVTGVQRDQSTRGEVNGTELTFTIARSPLLHNKHVGEWLLPAQSGVLPTVTAAVSTPSAQVAGGTVVLTGTGFFGATQVKFGAVVANLFIVNSDTQITVVVPPGTAGTANITVTTPAGTSSAFSYTRGA